MTKVLNNFRYDLLTILAIAGVIGLVIFSGAQAVHAFGCTSGLENISGIDDSRSAALLSTQSSPAIGSSLMFTRAPSAGFEYTFFP